MQPVYKTGVCIGIITQKLSLTAFSRKFQSTCLALRSPVIRAWKSPLKQELKSDLTRNLKGER